MKTLSIVLATYNESVNITRCLDSVKTIADEIIVVDGQSSDNTADLARQSGAKVISVPNNPMFHTNKQMAMDAATSDWVLQLDADEVVDGSLSEFIKKIKSSDSSEYSAFWIKRKNWFLGRFLTKGGQYPDPVIRLYKRGKASLPQKDVHEQMTVDGSIGLAEGHLLHHNAPTFSRYITNANRYTTQTAEQMKTKGVHLSVINDLKYLIVQPLITFCKLYFRHRGYVDGFPGFVFALFSGLHHALAYMKLGDLYRENSH